MLLRAQFDARLPEIRRFLDGKLDAERTGELITMMRRAGCLSDRQDHSYVLWFEPDVCSPVARSVVSFADNVVRTTPIVAINVVEK